MKLATLLLLAALATAVFAQYTITVSFASMDDCKAYVADTTKDSTIVQVSYLATDACVAIDTCSTSPDPKNPIPYFLVKCGATFSSSQMGTMSTSWTNGDCSGTADTKTWSKDGACGYPNPIYGPVTTSCQNNKIVQKSYTSAAKCTSGATTYPDVDTGSTLFTPFPELTSRLHQGL